MLHYNIFLTETKHNKKQNLSYKNCLSKEPLVSQAFFLITYNVLCQTIIRELSLW